MNDHVPNRLRLKHPRLRATVQRTGTATTPKNRRRKNTPLTSPEIFEEVTEVLKRPKFKLSEEEHQEIIDALKTVCEFTQPSQKIDVIQEDLEDNKILECAVECNADYIISGDQHQLKLNQFEKIKILPTAKFLEIFEKS